MTDIFASRLVGDLEYLRRYLSIDHEARTFELRLRDFAVLAKGQDAKEAILSWRPLTLGLDDCRVRIGADPELRAERVVLELTNEFDSLRDFDHLSWNLSLQAQGKTVAFYQGVCLV